MTPRKRTMIYEGTPLDALLLRVTADRTVLARELAARLEEIIAVACDVIEECEPDNVEEFPEQAKAWNALRVAVGQKGIWSVETPEPLPDVVAFLRRQA